MFQPKMSHVFGQCAKRFLPKCSCTQICGSMLQIPYTSLSKPYLSETIEKLARKMPPIAENGNNLAIVKPNCNTFKKLSCNYLLQILSPVSNDEYIRAIMAVLEKEGIKFMYSSSSEEQIEAHGVPAAYIGGSAGGLLVAFLAALMLRRFCVRLRKETEIDIELLDDQNKALFCRVSTESLN